MENQKDNVSKLYQGLLKNGYTQNELGDEAKFRQRMSDVDNRKMFYDYAKSRGDSLIGDYDTYMSRLDEAYTQSQSDDNAAFEANAERFRNGQPIEKVTTQSMIDAHPELGLQQPEQKQTAEQYAIENRPEMFGKRNASLMDLPLNLGGEDPGPLYQPQSMNNTLNNAYDTANDYAERVNARADISKRNLEDREYQKGQTKAQLRRLNQDVSDALGELQERVEVSQIDRFRPTNLQSMPVNPVNQELMPEYTALRKAQRLAEESENIINEAEKKGNTNFMAGLARGFWDNLNAEDYTFGADDAAQSAYLYQALDKAERGEQLTKAEETLLDAAVINMATQSYFAQDLGKGYGAGSVFVESIPFMLEMAINPISASGKTSAKMLLKYGLKKFANNKVAKVGARLLGDALAGAGMAATTGAGEVLEGTTDRLAKNYNYGVDADGNLYANKKADAMGMGEALVRSFTTRAIENQSEMIFNAFKGLGGFMKGVQDVLPGGVNKFFDMLSHNKAADAYRWLKKSPVFRNYLVKDIRNATQIGGIFEEYAEEVYNNLANFAIGEMSWDDVVDLDNNIDTFLGLAPTQVMFGLLGLGGAGAMRYQTRRTLEDLQATMNEQQRKQLEGLLDMGLDAEEVDVRGFIRNVMQNENYTIDNKRDMIKAAFYVAKQKGIDQLTEADVVDKVDAENSLIDSATDPSTGIYAEITAKLPDAKEGTIEVPGNVVGWFGKGDKRQPVFVAEGMENTEENRRVLKPGEWDASSVQEMPAEQVKELNEEMIREESAAQAELESKYAPEVLSAQMEQGVPFNTPTSKIVPVSPMTEGNGWIVEEYAMDENGNPSKNVNVRELTNDEYRDLLQAQLDANEAAQAESIKVEESNQAIVDNLQSKPMDDGTGRVMQPKGVQGDKVVYDIVDANGTVLEEGSMDAAQYNEVNTPETSGENVSPVEEVKPIGRGLFGEIYDQFKGRVKEGVNFLIKKRSGVLQGAFNRKEVGDIDLVWGNTKAGLAHIITKHVINQDDFSSVDNAVSTIEDVVTNGDISIQKDGRVAFSKDGYRVAIDRNEDGNWIVTALDTSRKQKEKKRSEQDATRLHQSIFGEENGELVSPQSASLSENKDSESNVQSQEKEQKPLHEREKSDVFRELGDRYGEKMPNKVAVTAKAFAEDVAKAQTKLDKAQEAYDNAPIGREEKAEKALEKARQEFEAIRKEADFWAEMDAEIKSAQLRRSEILNPQAQTEATNEPMTADEFVAQQLAAGNIVLNKDDYMRETGYGSEEANAMNGGAAKMFNEKGMTIKEAGDRLEEMAREEGLNFFDATSGRDALISVLGSVKSRKELNQYIANNRAEQAKRDAEAVRNELEKSVMDANYSSLEDYVLQMEADEMENPFADVDLDRIDAIFAEAEEEYQNFINNEQGRTSEIVEGNDNVLSEEQSDNTGRTEGIEDEGNSDGNGEGTLQQNEEAHADEVGYVLSDKTDNEGNRFYEREGDVDLWDLSPLFNKAGRQAAPIRFTERNMRHIIDEHKKELGDTERDVFSFLEGVFSNARILRRARGGAMFAIVENDKTDKAAIIKLFPSEHGDYYNVESAGYYRKNKWKENEEIIAELSEPAQSETASDVSKPQIPDNGGKESLNAETATISDNKDSNLSENNKENQENVSEFPLSESEYADRRSEELIREYADRRSEELIRENPDMDDVDAYNQALDEYPSYIGGMIRSGYLEDLYAKSSIKDRVTLGKIVQSAGFETSDISKKSLDESKSNKHSVGEKVIIRYLDGSLVEGVIEKADKGKITVRSVRTGRVYNVSEDRIVDKSKLNRDTVFFRDETPLQYAERIYKEERRRKPLRERAKQWSDKLGVKVKIMERLDDVTNPSAKRAISRGQVITGWFEESTGEVCLYMPNITSESEVDSTYIHEVVAHKGLRGLLGDKFDSFCDEVWDMMSDADRLEFSNYPGVSHLEGKEKSRAAADEYIAHIAENIDVTESVWSKLTELVKKFLKAIGIEPKMTNADIANTIKKSYQRLLSGVGAEGNVSGEGTMFSAKRTSDRRQEMSRVNNTVDQALSLVYGKDIKEIRKERQEQEQKRKEDAAEIYQSVLSGDFNDVTLQKINDYIDDATPLHPYGKRISQRLPQKLERGLHEGARTNAVDALFSRICESAVPASRRASEAGRREIEERKKEALKGWAIATNNWHTDLSDFADEEDFIRQGTDSKVYLAKDGKHVIKVSFGKPEGKRFRPDIDTTALFNSVFRNTAYEIVGYGEFDGKFARILKQPFVDFADKTALNAEEREEYMRTLGFEPINESKTAFSNGSIVAADLQKSNILKDAAGNISVIDADMKLHTKDVGGNYTYPPVEADLPEGTRFRFIGERGARNLDKAEEATTRLDNLAVARDMEAAFNAKKERVEKLKDSEPVEITGDEIPFSEDLKQYKKNALKYGKSLQGEYINKDTGSVIQLQRGRKNGGLNEVLQHNYKDKEHIQSVAAIPQIIEEGIYISYEANKEVEKNPDVAEYQHFVCGLNIGGEGYTVHSIVAVDKKGNRYYDHNLIHIEKGNLLDSLIGTTPGLNQEDSKNGFGTTPGTKLTTNSEYKYKRLISILQTNDKENAKKIKMATGWERGADGKWRYEVKDRFNVDAIERFVRGAYGKTFGAKVPLERVLKDDDTLLTEYPQLKETSVKFQRLGDSWGVYYPESNEIAINTNFIREEREISDRLERQKELVEQWKKPEESEKIMNMIKMLELNPEEVLKDAEEKLVGIEGELEFFKDQMRERLETTIVHEVQHAIQRIEGFEHGGNVDSAKKEMASLVKELGLPSNTTLGMLKQGFNEGYATAEQVEKANKVAEKRGFKDIESYLNSLNPERFYNNLSGEVEARNAARRSRVMNEEDMREYLASETEDVSREDQIFLNGALEEGTRFRVSDKGRKIQNEVDKFAEKYNSKETVVVEVASMTDEEIEEMFDSPASEVKEAIKEGLDGGYSEEEDKIYIFADNQLVDEMEDTMFHENLHGLFGERPEFIEEFFERAADKLPKLIKKLEKLGYTKEEIPEEAFVRVATAGILNGDLYHVRHYLPEDKADEYVELLNNFGYEQRQEFNSRILGIAGQQTGSESGEERKGGTVVQENAEREDAELQEEARRERKERLSELFNRVADEGLQGVLGNAAYDRMMMDIYSALPEDARREVVEDAFKHYGATDFVPAVSDYINAKADGNLWDKIVAIVRESLRKIGFDIDLNANEVRYLAWRSQKKLDRNNLLDVAEDIDKKYRLKVGEYNGSPTRFRVKKPQKIDLSDERPAIIKEYDKELKTSGFNFQEAFQDRMLSVKVLMEKIEAETGKKAKKFEDAYEAENQLSSKNKVDQERWLDKFYRPLLEELQKLSDKYGLETVRRYVYCKSGLERNVVLRQRDADAAYNEAKEELDEKLANGDITQAQYDVLLDKAEDQRNKTLSEDIDYSGLRGMLFNVRADELFKQYKEGNITEQEYKQKVNDLKKDKAKVIKGWKDFAEVSVSDLESRATSAEIDALWNKINAATNETLRIDFESGMIDRETYEAEKKMMKYYVPLRNWANTTAEDMYEYRHDMTPAVTSNQKTAKGRESEADNPIATIALMAQNAIVRGNRNKMKMAFYSFVVNRPTALASVRNVWYVRDANNQWQPQYADTSAASSEAEMKQIIEQFENNMEQLEAQGDAFRGRQKIGMNFRASGKQRDEHAVVVMINGKEYAVYVNGNPRAAQAMNGLTNNEAVDDAAKWIDALKRYYGAGLTSWNPDFIIPNLARDTIHATTMTFLDKGVMASVKYAANVPRMFSHVAKEISGVSTGDPKLHQYFEEFVANGGETGYTAIHTLEDYKKEYDKLMNEAKGLKGSIGKNTKEVIRKISKVLEAANRIAEDVNRFNAYVTSRESGAGVVESVSAAKNITVNFNRKGALNANHTIYGKVASWMSRWILFFNPSVQGIYQLVTKTKENPKRATALGASILASGFFVPMINDILVSMFGDDDDDYWNQSDYKRRNNWMLFVGDGYISVPLPPVLRELYGIGDIMYGVITGHIPAQRAVYDLLKQVQSAVGFVNVIPEVSQEPDMITYVKGFAPDIVAPFMDVISNSNFMGRPIAKWTDYNESEPEYERVYKGVGKQWVELSKFMNELGGNETRRSDWWGNFINPAMMEHLFTSYTGGIGKTINNLAGMAIDAANGDTENMDVFRKTPVLHRFYTPNDEKTVVPSINRKFYEFKYQYDNAKKSLKKSQDGVKSDEHPEWQKYIDEMKKNGEYEFIEYFEKENKKLKKIQNLLKGNPSNKKELEQKEIDKKAEIAAESFRILRGER